MRRKNVLQPPIFVCVGSNVEPGDLQMEWTDAKVREGFDQNQPGGRLPAQTP
jgi:hypothetical protein